MQYDFDDTKDRENMRKHGISLSRADEFDLATARFTIDDAADYGETREIATGFLAGNLYVLVFTMRSDDVMRVISLRKANATERKVYAEH